MKKNEDVSRILGRWHEFSQKLAKAGLTFNQLQKVIESNDNNLAEKIVGLIEGRFDVKIAEHTIDCNTSPFIPKNSFVPDNLHVLVHKKDGKLKFDLSKLDLYVSEEQKRETENILSGEHLREELMLAGKKFLNANVLDYLLKNKYLIPNEWKKYGKDKCVRYIVFWGTIYQNPRNGDKFVRFLRWHDEDGWFSELASISGIDFNRQRRNYRYDQYHTPIIKD